MRTVRLSAYGGAYCDSCSKVHLFCGWRGDIDLVFCVSTGLIFAPLITRVYGGIDRIRFSSKVTSKELKNTRVLSCLSESLS